MIEDLWNEYLHKNVKPETSPEELKAIAQVFHWGAYLMFRELVELNKLCWREINTEFKNWEEEINGNVSGR